ncbi:MAG: hypothetical protein J6X31_03420 [Bacteroidales bacterium]|nr:hypothetical protein [Bacteroidales bacterium]
MAIADSSNYVKVTTAPKDWSGDYLIVYEPDRKAFDGSLPEEMLGKAPNTKTVKIKESTITTEANIEFTINRINANKKTYSIKSASGFYIGFGKNKQFASSKNTIYAHTIELDNNGNVTLTSSSCSLKCNYNKKYFNYYKKKNGAGAITLYKKTVTKPKHKANFSVNGQVITSSTVEEGDAILFTDPTIIPEGQTFMGWTNAAIAVSQETAPTYVESATMGEEDVTFYAVFATQTAAENAEWEKKTISEVVNNPETGVYALLTPDGHAFNGVIKDNKGKVTESTFEFSSNEAKEAPEGVCELTITKKGSGIEIKNAEGKIFIPEGKKTSLVWANSEGEDYWEVTNNNLVYSRNNSYLRSYNNQDFRNYDNNPANDTIAFAYKPTYGFTNYCTTVHTTQVTIADCGYTTVCLPYNAKAQDGVQAFALRDVDEKGMHFSPVDILIAGKGYVLQATAGAEVELSEVMEPSLDTINLMSGVVTRTLRESITYQGTGEYAYPWILAKDGTFKRYVGEYIPAGKAYVDGALIQKMKSSAANAFRVIFEDETTSLSQLNEESKAPAYYYNLQGQRVAQPTRSGAIYMERGNRKFIVK